jgi:hypothetical protein
LRQKYWRIQKCINKYRKYTQIFAATKSSKIIKYWRLPKILANTKNIGACSKYRCFMKIEADFQNLGVCSKLSRMSEMAEKLCGIVKFVRHIIYARTKVDVEISASDENCCAYQKNRRPSYAPIRKLGAQTLRLLTIWARQNLQLLTSSKSG